MHTINYDTENSILNDLPSIRFLITCLNSNVSILLVHQVDIKHGIKMSKILEKKYEEGSCESN